MSDKEKLIIQKLFKIAQNQQKILEKLAQVATDENVEYLKRAASTAAGNSGFPPNVTFSVVGQKGGPTSTPGGSQTETMAGYTVTINGAPKDNAVRQKYMDTLKRQVQTQKPNQPELANLSIIFAD